MSLFSRWEEAGARAAGGLVSGVLILVETWLGILHLRPVAAERSDEAQRERIRRGSWRFRQAYDEIAGSGMADELSKLFQTVLPRHAEFSAALIAWLDFIESLVQETEKAFSGTPGRGPFKARQVKAALLYFLRKTRLGVPHVPSELEPLLFEAAVDWSIEGVVLLANRHGLWEGVPQGPSRRPGFLVLLFQPLVGAVSSLRIVLTRLAWRAVLLRHPLLPAIKKQVDALAAMTAFQPRVFVSRTATVLEWLAKHRRQVVALIEIIALATQEAETFLEMTGPEKKAYARDVMLVFLEDSGLQRWAASPLVEVLIGGVIDAVVRLFNKRHAFPSQRRLQPAIAG